MIIKKTQVLLILFILISIVGFGQGWNQKKGEGYFQLSGTTLKSGQYFNDTKKIDIKPSSFSASSIALYGEYGFSDKLMGIIYLPFISNIYHNGSNHVIDDLSVKDVLPNQDIKRKGFGEMELGVAYAIQKDKPLVLNIYAFASMPLDGFDNSNTLQITDNEPTQILKLGWGYGGFYPLYLNGSVGFKNRNLGFSDAIVHSWAIGVKIKKSLILSIKVFGEHSLNNGPNDERKLFSMYSNNVGYLAYGPEIAYEHKEKIGAYFSVRSGTMARNVLGAGSVEGGIFFKLK